MIEKFNTLRSVQLLIGAIVSSRICFLNRLNTYKLYYKQHKFNFKVKYILNNRLTLLG